MADTDASSQACGQIITSAARCLGPGRPRRGSTSHRSALAGSEPCQFNNGVYQIRFLKWLLKKSASAKIMIFEIHGEPGYEQHRQIRVIRPDRTRQCKAVHVLVQNNVAYKNIDLIVLCQHQSILSVKGIEHLNTTRLEHGLHHLQHDWLVVYQKDVHACLFTSLGPLSANHCLLQSGHIPCEHFVVV